MRHYTYLALPLLAMSLGAGAASAGELTSEERRQGLQILLESRDGLADAVKGLSDAQWNFKPGPDRWSIAEVLEHTTVTTQLVCTIFPKLAQAPAPPERDEKQVDAMLLAKLPDRSVKFNAPEQLQPTGRWTPAAALERYNASWKELSDVLRTSSDLRGHAVKHPAFGPLDGYQWILAAAEHTKRHTSQILEVKQDPRYPAH